MELAVFVAAAVAGPLGQTIFAGVLSGGLITAAVAWRRAKPEAELSTLQGMKIALEEVRTERDEARRRADELHARCEAHEAHCIYLESRVKSLEARLRFEHIEPPTAPPEVPRYVRDDAAD